MSKGEWKTYRTRFLVKAKQLNARLSFIDPLGRKHSGRKGDYLVESSDGVTSIAPAVIFEDIYVPFETGTYRTRFLVRAKLLNSSLSFTDPRGRNHSGRKGDYLVESSDGVTSIAPAEIFEDIYVPFEIGEQTETPEEDWISPASRRTSAPDSEVMPPVSVNIPMPPGAIAPPKIGAHESAMRSDTSNSHEENSETA